MRRGAIIACLLSLGAAAVGDDSIVYSKHDLSVYGPGPVRAVNENQICIFCHVPHNASPAAPLWNRHNPTTHYRVYRSRTLDARTDQPVQTQRCRPHQIGAHIVIFRFSQSARPFLQQQKQKTFRKAILHLSVHRIGQILFKNMNKCIHHTVAGLPGWQRIRLCRIEDGKTGKQTIIHQCAFHPERPAGNNGPAVHFRTAGRQGYHCANRQRPANIRPLVFQK